MIFLEPMLAAKTDPTPGLLTTLCEDDNIYGEQKVDGDRMLVHVDEGRVLPMSRNGITLAGVSRGVLKEFEPLTANGRWVFDGEWLDVEQRYFLFDIIEAADESLADRTLEERRVFLETFVSHWNPNPDHIALLPVSRTHAEKCDLAMYVISERCEGMVFKDKRSPYVPTKRDRRRSEMWRKFKLRADLDCIVTDRGRDGHDNLVLSILRGGKPLEVGEVTAVNETGRIVEIGEVVNVTYQWMSPIGRLIQPTKPKLRRDVSPDQCTWEDQDIVFENKTVRRS